MKTEQYNYWKTVRLQNGKLAALALGGEGFVIMYEGYETPCQIVDRVELLDAMYGVAEETVSEILNALED